MILSNTKYSGLKAHHFPVKLMGCGFVLTAVSESPQLAWDAIRAGVREITRIEDLISSWREDSDTSEINRMAGIAPVQVDEELVQLIQRSLRISDLTGGAFDISGGLARFYYNFNNEENPLPSDEEIDELCTLINYRNIEVDTTNNTVFLKRKGMKIGFGGIGKGYAAYRAHCVMQKMGIHHGLINASGDLMAWGKPPQRENWSVNITDPNDKNSSIMEVVLPYGSVVTSGESESYTLVDGTKHSHIIDPRTGRSARGALSVSVISVNPELSDALATGISVLGVKHGLHLLNQLKGVEGIITSRDGRFHFSNGLKTT